MKKNGLFFVCVFTGILFLGSAVTAEDTIPVSVKVTDKQLYTAAEFTKKMAVILNHYKNTPLDSLQVKEYGEIPFTVELAGKDNKTASLYLRVRINTTDFLFIYDTGAAFNVITDQTLEKTGIPVDQSVNEILYLIAAEAKCGGGNFRQNIFCYIPGTSFGKDANGEDIAGIIGLDFFRRAASLCVDYKNRKIILNDDPVSYAGLEKLPLVPDADGTMPLYAVKINLGGTAGTALFDTGCSWLEVNKNTFGLPVKQVSWQQLLTMSGVETIKQYYADAGEIRFGSTVLKNVKVVMWDDYTFSYFPQYKDKDMILGINGFFDRYKVWFFPFSGYACIQPYETQ